MGSKSLRRILSGRRSKIFPGSNRLSSAPVAHCFALWREFSSVPRFFDDSGFRRFSFCERPIAEFAACRRREGRSVRRQGLSGGNQFRLSFFHLQFFCWLCLRRKQCPEISDGPFQALIEGYLGLPAEFAFGDRDIRATLRRIVCRKGLADDSRAG